MWIQSATRFMKGAPLFGLCSPAATCAGLMRIGSTCNDLDRSFDSLSMARGAYPRLRSVGVSLALAALSISVVTSEAATAGLSGTPSGLRVLGTNLLPGLAQLVPTGAPPAGGLPGVGHRV